MHQRKVQAVRSVDMEVNRGEIFGFVGPNGAGKTTVIKMLIGLLRPSAGEARILGRKLPDRKVQSRIGFLPEVANFYGYLTGLELLEFHGRLLGMPRSIRRKRIEELVERVGMSGRADRPIRKFSKGMSQRIGLAQALLSEPDFLVLDEPMSGLDPIGRRDVRDIILEEKRRGATVFFSSHILSDVEQLCDRVGIMVNGSLRSLGLLDEVKQTRVLSLEMTLTSWKEELLPDELRRAVREVRPHGEATTLILDPEVDVEQLLSRLMGGGARLLELKRNQESLEEIFLSEAGQ